MQKEQLLNLLGPQARAAFEEAKRLARARGGLLSPLHLVAALLESISPGDDASRSERARLLEAANMILATSFPAPGESLTVTKETQAVITSAGRRRRRAPSSRPRSRSGRQRARHPSVPAASRAGECDRQKSISGRAWI